MPLLARAPAKTSGGCNITRATREISSVFVFISDDKPTPSPTMMPIVTFMPTSMRPTMVPTSSRPLLYPRFTCSISDDEPTPSPTVALTISTVDPTFMLPTMEPTMFRTTTMSTMMPTMETSTCSNGFPGIQTGNVCCAVEVSSSIQRGV